MEGRVQGVGFRPAVYRHGVESGLAGFVVNTPFGVYIEAEGTSAGIKNFLDAIKYNPPLQAEIRHLSVSFVPAKNETGFRIEKSRVFAGAKKQKLSQNGLRIEASPDIATCSACQKELFSPGDRRHLFPFINCTDCGPRFTIIKELPYDRKNTSMYRFMMCPDCYGEYVNPLDRRFHAQPDCCFACGPEYSLFKGKDRLSTGTDAIKRAARLICRGCIVGVKGIGGYHLVCDAANVSAVKKLRERKKRGDKPFALMAKDIQSIRQYCAVSRAEKDLLVSWRAPVVILRKKGSCGLPVEIAPGNKYLGFFLPYSPVHHLLFHFGGIKAIVATSGNIGGEPLVYKDGDAFEKLADVAEYLLAGNREIETGCDDSVARIESFDNKVHLIRRARGFVPEPFKFPFRFNSPVFAAGPNEKNTFSLGVEDSIITSQHIGNLEGLDTLNFYTSAYEHFKKVAGVNPSLIAHDLHPDYLSTRFARELAAKEGIPAVGVQHHHAHIASCMIENGLPDMKVIGVALDGAGYGEDGNIRGGEFMVADYKFCERLACLDFIPLPGGDKAVKEVWRTGLAYLYQAFGEEIFNMEIPLLKKAGKAKISLVADMLKNNVNSPRVSSMGRLFDAVSAITGLREETTYDAQAAVELEMVLRKSRAAPYEVELKEGKEGMLILDPLPLIKGVAEDVKKGRGKGYISYRFHIGMVAIITETCKRIKREKNISVAVLSGGVFQNSFMLDSTYRALTGEGFEVFVHSRLPSNDGCISTGQAAIAGFYRRRQSLR